nr:hypothetical protein Iba_chr12cCG9510 [Ipomoea batatas]
MAHIVLQICGSVLLPSGSPGDLLVSVHRRIDLMICHPRSFQTPCAVSIHRTLLPIEGDRVRTIQDFTMLLHLSQTRYFSKSSSDGFGMVPLMKVDLAAGVAAGAEEEGAVFPVSIGIDRLLIGGQSAIAREEGAPSLKALIPCYGAQYCGGVKICRSKMSGIG